MVNHSPVIVSYDEKGTCGTFNACFSNSSHLNANMSESSTHLNANMGIVNATESDYNKLSNKPSINGVILEGDKSSKDFKLDSDKTYVHYQRVQSDVWEIQHDLDKYPSVFIVDSANSAVVGDIHYVDANKVVVTFSAPFSGKAFCN